MTRNNARASILTAASLLNPFVQGNAILNQYLHVINHDIKALLVWKTRGTLHAADGLGGGSK